MPMLSELLRWDVTDTAGHWASLADLIVDVAAGDYPPVTHVIVTGPGKKLMVLPWETVQSIDSGDSKFVVADLNAAMEASTSFLATSVLLKRDILDALILDLQARGAMRANDLWLEEENRQLTLRAVDASFSAILRRLSRDTFGHGRNLHDWKYIEFLRGDPEAARSGADYHRRIASLPPGEIAILTDSLPYLHAAELITLLPDPLAADTLEDMEPERQVQIYEELDDDRRTHILALMRPDEAADLIGHLQPDAAQIALERLPGERRAQVVDLLRYPEDTAGGIMNNDIIVVPAGLTIGEACQLLRDRLSEPDFVYFIYVIDHEETQRLLGVLTLRDLLVTRPEDLVTNVMRPNLVTIFPLEPANTAARRVTDSGLLALPVISRDGRLLGAVTVDSAVARIAPESWRAQAPRIFS